MAYRNGTYVAFHANNTPNPTLSDMRYYSILLSWKVRDACDFLLINSHEKASSVRSTSLRSTLEDSLMERLRNSKNMILIITSLTRNDTDWVPFEIEKAIDLYELPIIAAYPEYDYIMDPARLSGLWPQALADRIHNGAAKVIHTPFKKEPISDALSQFDISNKPATGLNYYTKEAYAHFGIIIP